MNFFEHQDRARRKSGRLVLLFGIAVFAIIASVYLLIVVLLPLAGAVSYDEGEVGARASGLREMRWWDPMTMLWVTVAVGSVVVLGSLFKIAQLRGGGAVIAEELGGRPISPDTRDPGERRVLNVVEEMAIASGVAVPLVYLLEKERGINAFAAGYSARDAVIGVTRGTVETLSRDELQGVMAHEFSHILNGDMRLNIRLIGLLFGILVIGLIGQIILRTMVYAPHAGRGRRSDGGGWVILVAIGLGLGLAAIGFIGTVCGNLIKASVSRQREFLADASAVQFTRNPEGIGGALKKIGGLTYGSRVKSPMAGEASHMFFASGLVTSLGSLTATHPPLRDRIGRIDPGWDGAFPEVSTAWAENARRAGDDEATRRKVFMDVLTGATVAGVAGGAPARAASAVDDIGSLTDANLRYAAELIAHIPEPVRDAARDPFAARAVVLAMLLDEDPGVRARQDAIIAGVDDGMAREVGRLAPSIGSMDPRLRLSVLEITIGTLRSMSKPQYETFRRRVAELIAADAKRDLFEWVLLRMLRRHLDAHFNKGEARTTVQYYGLQRLVEECRVLLSTLAYAGAGDRADAERAFGAGARRLGIGLGAIAPPEACGLRQLDGALDKLEQVSMRLRKGILSACAACIAADREVTVREGELLRAISDDLDCPMPPLLPGQPLV